MKFNKDVCVAIDLISKLGNKPRTVASLAVELDTTEGFLAQIANKLKARGLLQVQRGPGGGVFTGLDKPSVLQILKALGHETQVARANNKSAAIRNQLLHFLSNTSVGAV